MYSKGNNLYRKQVDDMALQSIFKRYEKKYLLCAGQYEEFRRRTENYLEPDRFWRATVCSMYFDTPDSRLILRSLEHPVYKEKLRLRSYGVPSGDSRVFVEVKKKYKGEVFKRRIHMTLSEARSYLSGCNPPKDSQISREIEQMLNFYPDLRPAMFICCSREALCAATEKALRVTFDSDILYRTAGTLDDMTPHGSPLLEPGQRLMEIKVEGAMPLWLAEILDELKIYPTSFSKYGRAYMSVLAKKNERGVNGCA